MEKQLNYNVMPSLKHMALRTITASLWNQKDIKHLAALFCFQPIFNNDEHQQWQTIVEEKVKQNIYKLVMPESLISELIKLIKPIGLEILKWIMSHEKILGDSCILNRLFWTSLGTVNYKKTAEFLITDDQLDLVKRYKIACVYCLYNDIPALWEKLSENERMNFCCKDNPSRLVQHELVLLWTSIIKGEANKFNRRIKLRWEECTLNQYAFKYAACSGNKIATEYFFQKLTLKEREECLVETTQCVAKARCDTYSSCSFDFPKESYCDVIAYLLSQCNEVEQIQVFQKYPYRVLKCFMSWPWQDLFIQIVGHIWTSLPKFDYNTLLWILTENLNMFGYNYHKIIREFWLQSPISYKNFVINRQCRIGGFLSDLFKAEDKENIKFLLRNVTTVDKERMITCYSGVHICHNLIMKNKWDLLKLFIQESMLSEAGVTKLKEEFQKCLPMFYTERQIKWRKQKWNKFYQLLDDSNINLTGKGNIKSEEYNPDDIVPNDHQKKKLKK
ncbi:ANK_REP_REGION domain-containing protein [Caerostris darwini]|uniref:ANK_REP_REGION domain-containing protein n=1 Tax=Caerostris darwini TaxID=1538125 RepID=A0AAV4T6Z7_9ARAC|nr:ANK_REP_REGION domain-containing protein [Caerostris darwini]